MSQLLHLSNNQHFTLLGSSLKSLIDSSLLYDITLVCIDGNLSAHKLILASVSNVFHTIICDSKTISSPSLVYLRGVSSKQMKAMLSYAYFGYVKVSEQDLPDFLALAEDLKIQGFSHSKEKSGLDTEESFNNDSNRKNNALKKDYLEKINAKEYSTVHDVLAPWPTQEDKAASLDLKDSQCQNTPPILSENLSVNCFLDHEDEKDKKCAISSKTLKQEIKKEEKEHTNKSTTVNEASSGDSDLEQHHISRSVRISKSNEITKCFIPNQSKVKNKSQQHQCPVCDNISTSISLLKAHLLSERKRIKCNDCELWFSSCQSVLFHTKTKKCRAKKNSLL